MTVLRTVLFPSCVIAFTLVATAQQPNRPNVAVPSSSVPPEYISGPYEVVPNWPQVMDKSMSWGRTPTVFAESPNKVFVMQSGFVPWAWKKVPSPGGSVPGQRASNIATHCASTYTVPAGKCVPAGADLIVEQRSGIPVPGAKWEHILNVFDANGKLIDSWEQHNKLFTHPHSLVINPADPQRHVWVIDDESEQVFKFTNDGKLVMSLGEFRKIGNDATHFGGPTGIAWLPNGDFYISDGYKNSRVVKYSKDGKFLMQWGKEGRGPGEFRTPHGIAIDSKGRLYVADRANDRIQIFDQAGKFLTEWKNIGMPNFIAMSKDGYVWVADGRNDKILKYDQNGKLLYSWGTFGAQPGQIWCVHGFSVDGEGNLYVGEVFGGRSQKFRPRKGADPNHLIGPLQYSFGR